MTSTQISPRLVIFVVVSLLTHLMDVAAGGLFCHMLMQQDDLKTPWFSISAGLLIIPLVGLQLISAVYLLRRKGDSSTTMEVVLTAVLHVLQLGFISRHFAILQESSIPSKKYEIAEMLVLRMIFSLTCGFPLLLIKMHILFLGSHEASWEWTLYLTSATSLLAITWALATFRRRLSGLTIDALLITCPGTILKILWRAGEITTRVIALALFASIYSYWFFMVIGLHWFAMLICVCVPAITPLDIQSNSFVYRFFCSLIASFTYVFVFINTTCENTVFRYTFYYIIFFLENTTLLTVWAVQASSGEFGKHEAFVYVAAVSFTVSIIAMIVYYKFFHIASPKEDPSAVCGNPTCVTCKHDGIVNHPPIPPRPGASGNWLSQYHTAIYCGQHCKHVGHQDSLLDSTSEKNSILTVSSSHARIQQKLATLESDNIDNSLSCKSARATASSHLDSSTSEQHSVSPRAKPPRKKSKKKKESKSKTESEKTSEKTEGNVSEGSGSHKQPVWLPSGDSNFANQLLTYSLDTFDTNNTADDERSSIATGVQGASFGREMPSREMPSVHKHRNNPTWSTSKDRHWYSDGYSTDRTLDMSNFPVTSIPRNVYSSSLDTDEDHFHCQECSHGDSEVSSIMRSIDDVPETLQSGRRSQEISPRHRNGEDQRKYQHPHLHHHQHHQSHHNDHHHHHHHHHRSTHRHHRHGRNVDAKTKTSDDSNGLSLNGPENANTMELKPHVSGSSRTHMLSSPASDPSHGPRSRRKGSPKRRVHGSAHPERSASKHRSTNQSNVNMKDHHGPISRLPATDDPIAQSEQIAKDLLLRNSLASGKTKKGPSSSTAQTSDPRFNVRVMVSQSEESPRSKYNSTDKDLAPKSIDNKCADNQMENKSREKKKIFGVTEKETDVDTCIPPANNQEDLTASPRSPRDLSSVSQDRPSIRSAASSDVQTSSSENSPHSDSAVGKDEVIYENIWQVKPDDRNTTKSRQGIQNRAFVQDEHSSKILSHSSSSGRDAWYMCSESEDSALPPEALSSSVDGFTASENGSDVSEIVI